MLTTEALAFIAVIIGLLLLIVPGIFAALYLAFTLPAAALRDRKIFAAFGYSKDLVSGRGGEVLVRLLAMSVPLIAAAVITIVGSVLLESGELSVPAAMNDEFTIAAVSLAWFTLIDVSYLPLSLAALILFFNLERVQAFDQIAVRQGTS